MDKDLNIRTATIKILEENIGSKISNTACSNSLSDISPQTRKQKEKQMGLHKTKNFLHKKEKPSTKQKDNPLNGEHIHRYILISG